jgi:hypothetical protein
MNGCDVCHHGLEVDSEPLLLLLLTLTFISSWSGGEGISEEKGKERSLACPLTLSLINSTLYSLTHKTT